MNNYTDQIADVLSGNADIRNISDDIIQNLLSKYPYSPYSHLVHYLKAKSTNRIDTEQLLQKLAVYSPDRAWLQTVLNTQFQEMDTDEREVGATVPSEAKDPNLDKYLFEFDFNALEQAGNTEETNNPTEDAVIFEESPKAQQPLASNPHEEEYTPKQGSYIAWLKTMRPEQEVEERSTPKTKQPAKKIVEKNTRKDDDLFGGIITETLAELLANQGQIEKAINMYDRLSLIFPNKSAFFAAKIEQLKSNIT